MGGNIIVMGANGGTGEALAMRLYKSGHDVYATMRDPDQASDALKESTKGIFRVDVTDQASIENAFHIFSEDNPVAGFAYCIGTIDLRPFKATNDGDFLKSYEINVLGAVRSLRLLEKAIKSGKGSAVLFSSIAATNGFTNHTVIGSSKAALAGLATSLAAEWAGQARVNVIAPSLTDTGIAKPLTSSPQMRDAIEKMHPIPRLGAPEDLAAAAEFLLGTDSGWITGQTIPVDGGRSTLRPKG